MDLEIFWKFLKMGQKALRLKYVEKLAQIHQLYLIFGLRDFLEIFKNGPKSTAIKICREISTNPSFNFDFWT